jgi:hypothetical protein
LHHASRVPSEGLGESFEDPLKKCELFPVKKLSTSRHLFNLDVHGLKMLNNNKEENKVEKNNLTLSG